MIGEIFYIGLGVILVAWLLLSFLTTNLTHTFLTSRSCATHLPWYVRWEIWGDDCAQKSIEVLGISEWVRQMNMRLR